MLGNSNLRTPESAERVGASFTARATRTTVVDLVQRAAKPATWGELRAALQVLTTAVVPTWSVSDCESVVCFVSSLINGEPVTATTELDLVDLARAIERDVRIDFLQASSYGSGTESSGNVRIVRDLDHDISGCDAS